MRPRRRSSLNRPQSPRRASRASFLRPELATAGNSLPRRHRPDYILAILTLLLAVIGLIVIYSISPALAAMGHTSGSYYVEKQLLAVVLAVIAFIAASRIPLTIWRRYARPLLVLAILATLVALVLPVNPNYPAHRWVRLGSFSFQSVEILKLALLVWLASLLAKNSNSDKIKQFSATFKPLIIVLVLVGLVIAGLQSDLGSTGVILLMTLAMAFVAGVPFKKILIFGTVILLVGLLAVAISPYRRARLTTFMNPTSNCESANGYQACQALISVGSGGFFGLGLGRGVQAYGYLPEADNDSIFAIYAEKFGFIGSVILLAVFTALFARMKQIAERAPDDYSRLLVVGVLAWLGVEMLINIGGMIGVLPLKGITLPFISYGGTSMIFSAAAMGLVFQVSAYTSFSSPRIRADKKEVKSGHRDERRRLGRPYYAATSDRG